MLRYFRLLSLLAPLLPTLAAPGCGESCEPGMSIVGNWVLDPLSLKSTELEAIADSLQLEVTFAADGTYTTRTRMQVMDREELIESAGTWVLEGEVLTVARTHRNGEPVEEDPRIGILDDGRLVFVDEEQAFALIPK